MTALGTAGGLWGSYTTESVALDAAVAGGGWNLYTFTPVALDTARLTFIHFENQDGSAGGFIPLSPDGGARS